MKRQLMAGASALALITAAGAGITLADITQTVGNDTPDGGGTTSNSIAITVTGGVVSTGAISGTAAQDTISTTGALASVFAIANGGGFTGASLGVIKQTVVNLGEIVNGSNTVTVGGDISGAGGMGSIAGTGAAASVTEMLIAVPGPTTFSGGNTADSVTSMVFNGGGDPAGGAVGVTDATVSADLLSGNASGLSVAGTGATADVSVSAIGSDLGATYVAPVIDTITQGSSNGTPGPVTVTDADVDAAGLGGLGASASVSATGAATAVRNSSVNSDGALGGSFGAIGGITQSPGNYGDILNEGARVNVAGEVSGDGASATIGATGASAAVGVASISSGRIGSSTFGDITQGAGLWGTAPSNGVVYNRGAVTVTDAAVRTGELAGAASSLGIGATGAVASVFEQDIGSTDYPGAAFGSVDSTVLNVGNVTVENAAVLVNDADSSVPNRMRISGDGASAFISAAGAAASVSSNSIGGSGFTGGTFSGNITQDVTNAGHILVEPGTGGALSVTARNITGDGASASISAAGATASVSSAAIDGAGFTGPVFAADINQTVTNASATDPGVGPLTGSGMVTVTDATVNVYALSGDGASAVISAAGASAGVSALGIGVGGTYKPMSVTGDIAQTVTNGLPGDATAGSVSITDSSITARDLSGAGSSASIAAVGASASVTGTAINVAAVVGPAIWYGGNVAQSATNHAPITVASATITTGALSGAGASAGISAVGASAVVGVTSIGSGVAP